MQSGLTIQSYNLLRKVVNGLDTISDLVEPVTGKYTGEDARNAAKNILKDMWNTVTGGF